MPTFVMLTRLSPEAMASPDAVETLERTVKQEIEKRCPGIEWVANYAILGPCDYLDIFRAPDTDTAAKVATVVRSFGHAQTEMWSAIEWHRFRELVK